MIKEGFREKRNLESNSEVEKAKRNRVRDGVIGGVGAGEKTAQLKGKRRKVLIVKDDGIKRTRERERDR